MPCRDASQAIHGPDHPSAKVKVYPWRLNTIRITEAQARALQDLKDEKGWSEPECIRRALDLLFEQHPGICDVESRAI